MENKILSPGEILERNTPRIDFQDGWIDKPDVLTAMREYAAQFQQKWLPISEAPKDGSDQFVGYFGIGGWKVATAFYWSGGNYWVDSSIAIYPTHYLPQPSNLPSPPTQP